MSRAWGKTGLLLVLSVGAAISFGVSLVKGWTIQGNRGAMCATGDLTQNSYVQLEVFEQDPVEPIFRGNILMLFSQKDVPEGTNMVSVGTVAGHGYYGNLDEAKLVFQSKRQRKYTVDDRHSLFSNLWTSPTNHEPCDVLLHLQFMRAWLLLAERHLMLRLFGAMVRGLREVTLAARAG